MKDITCPKCGTIFQVDEREYASIAAQVRNAEFEQELATRISQLETRMHAERKLEEAAADSRWQKKLADLELRLTRDASEQRRKQDLENSATEKMLMNKLAEREAEIAKKEKEISGNIKELSELRQKVDNAGKDLELTILKEKQVWNEKLHEKEVTISDLRTRISGAEEIARTREKELISSHALMLKAKDEEIEHYKNMKARMSTKMIGETLEQHCYNMFNRARSQGMYPYAYFEKDNDISKNSKGDFIFRDYIVDPENPADRDEYISIMFEMKNEMEETAVKQHNEQFFQKLHKDRCDKNCEYAVLVSTLEADNDLYNEGIVDVSYRYPKMLVVRPQFFMAVIAMLSQTARRGAERLVGLRRELELARMQSVDVSKFEERRDKFVREFGKYVEDHGKKVEAATSAIDKMIENFEKQIKGLRDIKAMFETSATKLNRANDKIENDFTIKKLTHGNPTMRAKFEEVRKERLESRDKRGESRD